MTMGNPLRNWTWTAIIAGCLCCSLSSLAQNFSVTSGYVGNPDTQGNVAFSLTFNCVPDFRTVDEYGRSAYNFQFYLATNAVVPPTDQDPPSPYACVIRGPEDISVIGEIRVRGNPPELMDTNAPPNDDPLSGGWGPVQGSTLYSMTGPTMTFSLPASALNVTGSFAYGLLLVTYGGWSTHYSGLSGHLFGDTPQAAQPLLTASHVGTNVVVSWPTPYTGFVLQQNTNVNTTNWTTSSLKITKDSVTSRVTVPAASSKLFFRLAK